MTTVTIVIEGGVLQSVLSEDPQIEIQLIDFDEGYDDLEVREQLRLNLEEAERDMSRVY